MLKKDCIKMIFVFINTLIHLIVSRHQFSPILCHWGHLSLSAKVVSLDVQQHCSWLYHAQTNTTPSFRIRHPINSQIDHSGQRAWERPERRYFTEFWSVVSRVGVSLVSGVRVGVSLVSGVMSGRVSGQWCHEWACLWSVVLWVGVLWSVVSWVGVSLVIGVMSGRVSGQWVMGGRVSGQWCNEWACLWSVLSWVGVVSASGVMSGRVTGQWCYECGMSSGQWCHEWVCLWSVV